MQTVRLTVGPDGRVSIPGTRPGESVTIQVAHREQVGPQTLRTAQTKVERARVTAEILDMARQLRAELPEEWREGDHSEFLYGEDGLPR